MCGEAFASFLWDVLDTVIRWCKGSREMQPTIAEMMRAWREGFCKASLLPKRVNLLTQVLRSKSLSRRSQLPHAAQRKGRPGATALGLERCLLPSCPGRAHQ